MGLMSMLGVRRAQELLNQGLRAVRVGQFPVARDLFKKSTECYESAEAVTYWAWMEHQLGNTLLAIELCERAITIDPDFGNPYNDIGSYLISLGQLDEAIPWLKKAIKSKRYESRHYPHINLAQIFQTKNMPLKAVREYISALEFVPGDSSINEKLENLRKTIN